MGVDLASRGSGAFTAQQAWLGDTRSVDTAEATRYLAATKSTYSREPGEPSVSKTSIFTTAALAFAVALPTTAPAAAQTAAQRPAGQAAPAAQQQPTRANLLRGLDTNFKAVDTNGDGNLSAAELAAAESKVQQRRIAGVRTRYEGEFTKLDTNKDGQLSKAEFMVAAPNPASATPNGAALVTRLDSNKDGKVTMAEYQAPVLSNFDKADTNKDGVLSQAERQPKKK